MSAFVPSVTRLPARGFNPPAAACRPVAPIHTPPSAPFFASTAFGAPLPTRVQLPKPVAPVTMEVTIVVGDSEPVESALRRFKKDVSKSGHLFELRRRRYFETNTEKRIRKAAQSRRKARMARTSNNKAHNNNQQK